MSTVRGSRQFSSRVAQCAAALSCIGVLVLVACRPDSKIFQPPGADFVIAMPGKVRCGADQQETSLATLAGHSCSVEVGAETWSRVLTGRFSTTYLLSWFELPSRAGEREVPALLSELKSRTVEMLTEPLASRSARLADRTPLAVQEMSKSFPRGPEPPPPLEKTSEMTNVAMDGAQGVEFETVLTEANSAACRAVWRERLVVRGDRLYRLVVTGFDLEASKDGVWVRMLESFRFVPENRDAGR